MRIANEYTRVKMAEEPWKEKKQKKGKNVDDMPEENGIEDEPDFSDPEDYVDDIGDEGWSLVQEKLDDMCSSCLLSRKNSMFKKPVTCQMPLCTPWGQEKIDK